jgi:hypothetical protein
MASSITSHETVHEESKKNTKRPLYRRSLKPALWAVAAVAIILLMVRIYLPFWVKDHVNETLNNIQGYSGSVADIDLALYRGAYVIHKLKLNKQDKNIPVPFLDIDKIDLSLQWGALLRGEIVGDVTMTRPTINFATGRSGQTSQTGTETDWTIPIKELMPLDINFVEINDGRVHYRNFASTPNVDLYIKDMYAKATNLRNVDDVNNALPSDITIRGASIGGGKFIADGKVNILKRIPDASLEAKLESVNLPALNEYARSFAGIDFTKGNFDLYTGLDIKDGKLNGFIKPLATQIELIDPQEDNPLNLLWESVVSVVIEIFTNQSKDQFGTQVQITGDINNPETNFWETLRGILRNAFVKAYSNTIQQE